MKNRMVNEIIAMADTGAVVTGIHAQLGAFIGFVESYRVKYGNGIQLRVALDTESKNNTGRDGFLIDADEIIDGFGGVFSDLKIMKKS